MLQLCKIYSCPSGVLGLHLSRAPWDPYPWVSGVQADSSAYHAGLRVGDTILELNGCDILGQKISEMALYIREHWQSGAAYVTVGVWRRQLDEGEETESDGVESANEQHSINQQSLQKFATCLQHIAQLLECPVCLEVIKPPGWQCCNGHVLCNNCRSRSVKCPVCRVPLGPRGRCLLSDKLFTLLAESFPCESVRRNRTPPPIGHPVIHHHLQKTKGIRKKKDFQSNAKHKDGAKESNEITRLNDPTDEKTTNKTSTNVARSQSNPTNDNSVSSIYLGRRSRRAKLSSHQAEHEPKEDITRAKGECEVAVYQKPLLDRLSNSDNTLAATDSSFHNNNNNIITSANNNRNNKNFLVKLRLKSTKKAVDYTMPTAVASGGTLSENKESLDIAIAIVNNAGETNRKQQQQQQLQMQQYQNYHCPTGKSCWSYVKSSLDATKWGELCTNDTNKSGNIEPIASLTASCSMVTENKRCNGQCLSTMQPTNGWPTKTNATVTGTPYALAKRSTRMSNDAGRNITTASHRRTRTSSASTESFIEEHQESIQSSHVCSPTLSVALYILKHLAEEHQLTIQHFHGTFNERIPVEFRRDKSMMVCVNLLPQSINECVNTVSCSCVDRFLLACMPYDADIVTDTNVDDKYAVYLWHLPSNTKDARNFFNIIESKRLGIRWFGKVHALTKSWPQIRDEGHFLVYQCGDRALLEIDAFDIVIRMK